MSVLVDSSVWIEYFRGARADGELDLLIQEDLVVVNDLILTELVPALHLRRQTKLIGLMRGRKGTDNAREAGRKKRGMGKSEFCVLSPEFEEFEFMIMPSQPRLRHCCFRRIRRAARNSAKGLTSNGG